MSAGGETKQMMEGCPNFLHLFDPTITAASLPSDLSLKALKELEEKSEWRRRDIEALRQMVEAQSGLHSCLSDHFLLRFLRARKFDYDRALKLLINYYAVRSVQKEIFHQLTPSALKPLLDMGFISPLDGFDYHGRKIILFRAGKWNPSVCPLEDLIRLLLLNLELMITNESTQVCGVTVLVDMTEVTTTFAIQHLRPAIIRRCFGVTQDVFPCRLKGIHFIREPPLFDMIVTMLKPFMKEKFRQRLYFHGHQLESLTQHIDLDSLPTFLGGSASEPWPNPVWLETLAGSEEYFKQSATYSFTGINPLTSEEASTPLDIYRRVCIDSSLS